MGNAHPPPNHFPYSAFLDRTSAQHTAYFLIHVSPWKEHPSEDMDFRALLCL